MSSHEYKSALRKLEPQVAVRDCLLKVESLVFNTARGKQELMMSLISEFIFYEHTQHPMSSLQEFYLVLELSNYFSKASLAEQTGNAVFILLFGGSISPARINVLTKLTSTAISAQLSQVLNCVGTLMQQVGFSSLTSIELAKSLVQDFVVFSSKASTQLTELPKITPRFACNFMTAVTCLYLIEATQKSPLLEPPSLLLELFTSWITENPSLCLASQQPLMLPTGMLSMPNETPFAGLIRWSCVSALISTKEIYSKLHLSLLQSLLQAKPLAGPPVALNAQHLQLIVTILQYRMEELGKAAEKSEAVQLSMERFAQCIQVAIASQCIYGNIPQLMMRLETLRPTNQLMHIVISNYKK
ncbi:integrator complex subunit 15 [Culicoides brevitarsis]|uniref:integrator complex subunit 15 n=1 Tax=Culicoides brevitarsis TaxID=469753 RepID=UPI00307B209F